MNTTTVITGLLTTSSSRKAFRTEFKALAHRRELTAAHMALYALVMGKPLSATFSPITNPVKLANGQEAWGGALRAIRGAAYSLWAKELLTKIGAADAFDQVRHLASTVRTADLDAQYAARA